LKGLSRYWCSICRTDHNSKFLTPRSSCATDSQTETKVKIMLEGRMRFKSVYKLLICTCSKKVQNFLHFALAPNERYRHKDVQLTVNTITDIFIFSRVHTQFTIQGKISYMFRLEQDIVWVITLKKIKPTNRCEIFDTLTFAM
jgi:hypothetical protein